MKSIFAACIKHPIVTTISIVIIASTIWSFNSKKNDSKKPEQTTTAVSTTQSTTKETTKAETTTKAPEALSTQKGSGNITKIHYINVGQGDSILIDAGGRYMLIDAGTSASGSTIVSYLRSQGVKKLDCVVATHPHADHIGSMSLILNSFSVDHIILPDVVHTTKTFSTMLETVKARGVKAIKAKPGTMYTIGNCKFQIVGPTYIDNQNLNNSSVGIHLIRGKTAFMFSGDAEASAEAGMTKYNLKSDVLKVGHHGSRTSTSSNFLSAVSPTFAVISCGRNNKYGHPNNETLQKLKSKGVRVYRTDLQGTIVATSDGNKVTMSTVSTPKPKSTPTQAPVVRTTKKHTAKTTKKKSTPSTSYSYIGNRNSGIFHRSTCPSVKRMNDGNKVYFSSRSQASGYRPCKNCKP